jgi:hypothetical protein
MEEQLSLPGFLPRLVALYSPVMGSGKSVIAKYLEREHGFAVVKFAGALKAMTRVFLSRLGYDVKTVERMVEGDLKEKPLPLFTNSVVTPRSIMQTLGTEWGRHEIDLHVWTKVAMAEAALFMQQGQSVVIDDMRFFNEFQAVRMAGGLIVKVHRPGAQKTVGHVSEGALSDVEFDRALVNDGTIEDLHQKIEEIIL